MLISTDPRAFALRHMGEADSARVCTPRRMGEAEERLGAWPASGTLPSMPKGRADGASAAGGVGAERDTFTGLKGGLAGIMLLASEKASDNLA